MKGLTYREYLLTVLMLILAFNYVDRAVLGLALQDIKADLNLSDTQLGLLTGIAFALFYAFMGIPIARWADRGNRVTIISVTTALWSFAVALCGLAGSFVQLALIRAGVAVGEAGCIPPAHSLIADYFTRAERPRAVARYMLGFPVSVVIGYFIGGWLNELYGWRATFVILAVPGLLLAVVARFSLKEPRQDVSGTSRAAPLVETEVGIAETCRTLWRNVSFRHLMFSFSVLFFFNYGIGNWQPAFFIRSFGMQTGELGTWLTLIYGLGGLAGTYLGGEWGSRCNVGDEPAQLRTMALVYGIGAALSACVYLSPNKYVAFALMVPLVIGGTVATGPLFALIQNLVPARMRAMSIAIVYLFSNLVGMGIGPLATGALSDALHASAGEQSLRYALLIFCPGYVWAGWHLWHASKTVSRDLNGASIQAL